MDDKRMTIALFLPTDMISLWRQAFHEHAPHLDTCSPDELKNPQDIRYALCWQHTPGALSDFSELKVIFSMGAGVDHILRDPAIPDIPIVRMVSPDLTMRMSEYAVMHVLLHHRNHILYASQQSARQWITHEQCSARDTRVGVMGLGELGRDAAHKLSILGFSVAGWSRSPRTLDGIECFHGLDGLSAFLGRSDILLVLLPLTTETRGILNRDLFGKLAKDGPRGGGILINAGRGGLQVETDIIAALDAGDLIAASLDTFEHEPLAPTSPLWKRPEVIITPHNAANSEPQTLCRSICQQITAYESGRPLRNLVERQRGY